MRLYLKKGPKGLKAVRRGSFSLCVCWVVMRLTTTQSGVFRLYRRYASPGSGLGTRPNFHGDSWLWDIPCMCVCVCVCACVCAPACARVWVRVFMCMLLGVCVCVCLCVWIRPINYTHYRHTILFQHIPIVEEVASSVHSSGFEPGRKKCIFVPVSSALSCPRTYFWSWTRHTRIQYDDLGWLISV